MVDLPNWCFGTVHVTGRPRDIENFCKLFIFTEDEGNRSKEDSQFFARSFAETSWESFKKAHLGGTDADFTINFAWSAYSCLINGYPDGGKLITLVDACKQYGVDVVIDTEEPGMGFEEHMECTREGVLVDTSKDMPTYKCECGSEQWIPSNYDPDDEYCYECGKIGKWLPEVENEDSGVKS